MSLSNFLRFEKFLSKSIYCDREILIIFGAMASFLGWLIGSWLFLNYVLKKKTIQWHHTTSCLQIFILVKNLRNYHVANSRTANHKKMTQYQGPNWESYIAFSLLPKSHFAEIWFIKLFFCTPKTCTCSW